jgi:hypothetical protein
MYVRLGMLLSLAAVVPASAGELNADQARKFVMGKTFTYNCFEGTRGAGRIQQDGSVAGTVQFQGSGPVRYVRLPAGTLHAEGQKVCATVRGLPFQPCFNLNQTSEASFTGAISGLSFAYCTFDRNVREINIASAHRHHKRHAEKQHVEKPRVEAEARPPAEADGLRLNSLSH